MSSFHSLDDRLRSEPGARDYLSKLELEVHRNDVLAKHFQEMMIPPNVTIAIIEEGSDGVSGLGKGTGAVDRVSAGGLACFDISIHPHFALWLKQTVIFRCTVNTDTYPEAPPKVVCRTPLSSIDLPEGSGDDPYEDGYWRPLEDEDEKPIIEDDGTVRRMTLIRGEDDEELFREGWLDHYELGSIIHGLWLLFKPPPSQGGSAPFGTLYKPALQLVTWAPTAFAAGELGTLGMRRLPLLHGIAIGSLVFALLTEM